MEKISQEFRSNQEIIRILEVSKDLSESIFDELPVILLMLDDQKRILKINHLGEKLLNITEACALGFELDGLLPAGGFQPIDQYFEALQQSKPGSLISFESECSIADQRRFFHWELTPLSLAKSDQRHVHILIGSDTTEARTSFENWLSLQRDIAVGSTVQSMLLPKGQLFDLPGVQVAAFYEASAQVSGDFWWYRIFPGVGALVLVCDVMGHGVGSAIASGVAVGAIESIMGDLRLPTVEQISSRLLNIDSVLSARFERNFMFCVSAVWIPDQANKLVIWSCGLPLPIIMDDKKAPTPFTASRSSPFGIGENTELTPAIIKTAPGLSLFLFSDGCYEFTYEGKLFGRQKFKRLLEDSINLSTAEQIAKFGESHKTLRQTKHPSDDVTLIAIRCT